MWRSVAVLVAVALVGGSLTAYLTFRSDWQAIKHINVSRDLASHRPPASPRALNILLIGSDTRSGANGRIGGHQGISGARSDTVMMLHIAPGAHRIVVLSIPRDSVVPILTCTPEDGTPGQAAQPAGYVEQLNATFAYGGPGCLWKTIEQATGIRINDFIELTFAGFEHVINDIGGVNVCLPVAVHDLQSRLNLSAGRHHIYGREALAFWRVRYIGEGSDLQRIRRDQFLMASLIQGLEHSRLLHSPTELLSVISDIARHRFIATDTGLTPGRLFTIADELRAIKPGSVQFIEVPTQPYPGDPQAWVQWAQPQAARLFSAIAKDTRLPKSGHSKAPRRQLAGPVLDSLSPSHVRVAVLNGSTVPGQARRTAAGLANLGFRIVGQPAQAASGYLNSVIEYADTADLPAARTLAQVVSDVKIEQDPSLPAGTVRLILGSSFTRLKPLPASAGRAFSADRSASASSSASAGSGSDRNLARQYGGITGNAPTCGDASAFAGPDGSR